MSKISDWSTIEVNNTHLDELTLSGEGALYTNKLMCAIKEKFDDVDGKLANVQGAYVFKGTKADMTALEAVANPSVGDVYSVTALGGENYAWDGTAWDSLGTSDSNVVHTTGNEIIAGSKTFTENFFRMFTNYTAGDTPSDAAVSRFEFVDKNGYALGNLEQAIFNDGTDQITLHAFKSGDYSETASLWAQVTLDGTKRAGVSCEQFRGTLNSFPTLGISGSGRWGQIYSTESTISTSDERQKQSIGNIPSEVLDAWGECGFLQFQMRDAVRKKGPEARLHVGLVAQRIKAAFDAAGVPVDRYGFFCHDEWDAAPANGIDPAIEAGDEYSLRYEEALCLEAAYQRRRADRAEARLEALEERLAAVEAAMSAGDQNGN